MSLSLPRWPKLPPGHDPCITPEQALAGNLWRATDAQGGEYVVGARTGNLEGGGIWSESMDCWGRVTRKECHGGKWSNVTPDALTQHAAASAPAALRSEAWRLPNGSEPDRTGKRAVALDLCRTWIRGCMAARSSLWLHGVPGVGKTQVASWMLLDLAAQGVATERTTALGIASLITASWDTAYGAGVRSQVADHLLAWSACPVLLIDDFGTLPDRLDGVRTEIQALVDARWSNGRPTIVTSNFAASAIPGLDPRLASRFGSYAQINLPGRDYRKGGAV